MKIISKNKKAYFEYEILDKFEAGLVLLGTEVKSLRVGRASIQEAYAKLKNGEVWLVNCDISQYPNAQKNHEPKRPRKLLMHKREIKRLIGKMSQRGLTLIPTILYFKAGYAKVELALATGKRKYDKRQAIKEREMKRNLRSRVGRKER